MTRQSDNVYRLDHAVTKTQKNILNAFGLTDKNIEYRANWISEEKYDEATDKLKSLLDKKKALQTEELMNAVMKSSRSYEEILRCIRSDSSEEQEL